MKAKYLNSSQITEDSKITFYCLKSIGDNVGKLEKQSQKF